MKQDYKIRPDVKESLDEYAAHGRPTGGFLHAFLANDLMTAIGAADGENILAFREIAAYIYWEIPAECHGSYDAVENWLNRFRKEKPKGITCHYCHRTFENDAAYLSASCEGGHSHCE